MARRSWYVPPDEVRQHVDGQPIPVVSRQAQLNAAVELVAIADRAGGAISILFGRAPTGVPDERVTTELICTWQSRTGGRHEPEQDVRLSTPPADVEDEHAQQGEANGHVEPGLADEVLAATPAAQDEPQEN